MQDAAEYETHHDQEDDVAAGRLGVVHSGDGHLREGAGVDEELDAEEEDEALALGALDSGDGIVEAAEDDDAGYDLVGDLDDYVGHYEGFPGVGFAGSFADFVEGTLGDEKGLDLAEIMVSKAEREK